jgi:hypothetical protein
LAWRTGSFVAIGGIAVLIDFSTELQIPELAVVILALVSGELTKYLNR